MEVLRVCSNATALWRPSKVHLIQLSAGMVGDVSLDICTVSPDFTFNCPDGQLEQMLGKRGERQAWTCCSILEKMYMAEQRVKKSPPISHGKPRLSGQCHKLWSGESRQV